MYRVPPREERRLWRAGLCAIVSLVLHRMFLGTGGRPPPLWYRYMSNPAYIVSAGNG